jgi:DNA-directed RNA polymerase subunit alpha
LESGYGVTLGNALRRVLLSSLPGAAVTSVRINGVHHEFSPIPNVEEDTTALLLNIKQIRLKSEMDEPVRIHVEVRSEGPVTAGDVVCPPGVEVVNPELLLLTADSVLTGSETPSSRRVIRRRRAQVRWGFSWTHLYLRPQGELCGCHGRIGQQTNFDRLTMDI